MQRAWTIGVVTAMFAVNLSAAQAAELCVAPNGNDAWSGTLARPNADKSDGPVASLAGARDGTLCYRPLPGEDMTKAEVFAPVAQRFLVIQGDRAISGLSLRGVTVVRILRHRIEDVLVGRRP